MDPNKEELDLLEEEVHFETFVTADEKNTDFQSLEKVSEDNTKDIDSLRTRLSGPSSNKAGLQSVDKEKVNKLIYDISKVWQYYV